MAQTQTESTGTVSDTGAIPHTCGLYSVLGGLPQNWWGEGSGGVVALAAVAGCRLEVAATAVEESFFGLLPHRIPSLGTYVVPAANRLGLVLTNLSSTVEGAPVSEVVVGASDATRLAGWATLLAKQWLSANLRLRLGLGLQHGRYLLSFANPGSAVALAVVEAHGPRRRYGGVWTVAPNRRWPEPLQKLEDVDATPQSRVTGLWRVGNP